MEEVGLAFSLAMVVAMIIVLIRPGIQLGILLAPAVVFILASAGLNIALRRRTWRRLATDYRHMGRDEWVQANINHSRKIALHSIYALQVPLMLLVTYIPDVPTVATSVAGMAILTMASGSTAFFASYLLHSRQHTDE
jgi:hypothetical protein